MLWKAGKFTLALISDTAFRKSNEERLYHTPFWRRTAGYTGCHWDCQPYERLYAEIGVHSIHFRQKLAGNNEFIAFFTNCRIYWLRCGPELMMFHDLTPLEMGVPTLLAVACISQTALLPLRSLESLWSALTALPGEVKSLKGGACLIAFLEGLEWTFDITAVDAQPCLHWRAAVARWKF